MPSSIAAAQKPAPRKRNWKQSNATDGILAGQVLEAEHAGGFRRKGSSAGSVAVANVAEPSIGYGVDLVVAPLYPSASTIATLTGSGYFGGALLNAAQSLEERTYVFDDLTLRNCVVCPPVDVPTSLIGRSAIPAGGAYIVYGTAKSLARTWYGNEASAEDRIVAAPFLSSVLAPRVPLGTNVFAEQALVPALDSSDATRDAQLVLEAEYLKTLQQNWDGYGARPLDAAAVDEIVRLLQESLSGINVPAPDLIPGGGGSIQAEWRRKGYEVFFLRSREGEKELHVENVTTGKQFFFEGSEAVRMLRDWAKQIAD